MTASFTITDAVEETRRHLFGTWRGEMNRLTSGIDASVTTMTVDFDLSGITRGSYLSVDDEILYVWQTNAPTRTITVQRAMQGTTAASHATGALVDVNPRFPRFSIKQALREEIRSWGPQLYRVENATIATTMDRRGYDLTALGDFYAILDVRRSSPISTGQTDPQSWPRVSWRYVAPANTTDFASGKALVVTDPGVVSSSPLPNLQVTYAASFDVDTAWADTIDLVANVGLDSSMLDIPPIGAAWRLLAMRVIKRTFTESQGEAGSLNEVPMQSIAMASQQLQRLRDDRLADEQLELRMRYPFTGWGS